MGSLGSLRQLDVSCNELQVLPASLGQLHSLRDLNVRRNQLSALPQELSELPLVRLDFSCNRVTRIPVCYRHLRHLQTILLENNPLQSPPAQICLKGKIHIFKYLNVEACSKAVPDLAEFTRASRPTGFNTCLTDEFFLMRQCGGLDSGFNSVDSGSKRWSGNESTDEFSDLSCRIAELAREPRLSKEKRDRAANGDAEQIDFIDSSMEEEEAKPEGGSQGVAPAEEKRKAEKSLPHRADAGEKASNSRPSVGPGPPREEPPSEERRRPETLQIWQERERRSQALEKRDSMLRVTAKGGPGGVQGPANSNGPAESSGLPHRKQRTQATDPPSVSSPVSRQLEPLTSQACSPPGREPGAAQKPSSFLFRSSSRSAVKPSSASPPEPPLDPLRLRIGSHDPDEKELMAELRQALESRLSVTLAEDLGEALANGAILCQLANHLRPRSVPFIHVPSPAVPKLSMLKSRKNVESFLEACRRLGVPEDSLCQPQHVLHEESLAPLALTVRALLSVAQPQKKPLSLDGAPSRT
uniref:Calponin-homology (CH) domain-containing protein n=1 Tax=Pelusios castaneus TaxID=367368 RepID=A0A8C8RJI5_9SAUR